MFNIPFLQKKNYTDNNIALRDKNIKLVVGLGNPGDKYKDTYHNVGFMLVDFLLKNAPENEFGELPKWESAKSFRYIKTGNLILAKPDTFMNNSGSSIKELLRYFKLKPEEILVIHDDADIALGEYKFLFGRGSAGHKGVDSIINLLGTKDFYRLRIGIRKRAGRAQEFVLSKIGNKDNDLLNQVFKEILEAKDLLKT